MLPRIVLDTNVLLVSVSQRSSRHWIWQALRRQSFDLVVSTSITMEYGEVVGRHMGRAVAEDVASFLRVAPNVRAIEHTYRWGLITADPDDNKFVDAAIAGRADALVTEDRHFDVLKALDFPQVPVLRIREFRTLLKPAAP